jgi:hypothetical protein
MIAVIRSQFFPLPSYCRVSIAAGQNMTFLAKPDAKLSDLPRHPVDVHPSPECMEGDASQCDGVSAVFIVHI